MIDSPPETLKIQRWGNSAAIRITAPLMRAMGLQIGGVLNVVSASSTGLHLQPVSNPRPEYALTDLLAQCDPAAPPPSMPETLSDE